MIGGLTSARTAECWARRTTELFYESPATSSRKSKPDTAWLAEFAAVPGYHILLCHHPEYYPCLPEAIELVVSGHAHGGQWRVRNHGVYAPGQGLWPKWTRGVYDGRLIVSAGLSNTTFAPRINNPTEIVFIN